MVLHDRLPDACLDQVRQMCRLLYAANTNIDYFPTNFILQDGVLYYVDYECNDYMDEWNFENWGVKYWSKTPEFLAHAAATGKRRPPFRAQTGGKPFDPVKDKAAGKHCKLGQREGQPHKAKAPKMQHPGKGHQQHDLPQHRDEQAAFAPADALEIDGEHHGGTGRHKAEGDTPQRRHADGQDGRVGEKIESSHSGTAQNAAVASAITATEIRTAQRSVSRTRPALPAPGYS